MLTSSDFNVRGKLSLRGNSNNLGGNNSKVENKGFLGNNFIDAWLSVTPATLLAIADNFVADH